MKKYSFYKIVFAALYGFMPVASHASESNDSVDSYTNHMVSSTVTVQGRGELTVSSVSVTPTGDLTLAAPDNITISGPFTVEEGGQLNAFVQTRPLIWYSYDAAGNRIRRELKQVKNAIR